MAKYVDADKMLKEYEHGIYDTTDLAEMLYYMPTADVAEVRHGRWIHKDPSGTSCSKCGSLFPMFMGLYDYCPNCGAYMVDKDE